MQTVNRNDPGAFRRVPTQPGPACPRTPAGIKEMTPDQAAASQLFRQNLNAVDPTGVLRRRGGFGQAYSRFGNHMVANSPMRHEPGGSVNVPPRYHAPGTTQIIHSNPGPGGPPSAADYFSAYVQSLGGHHGVQVEMLYHHGEDKFYGYDGKADPATGQPSFHELVNPYDMGAPRTGAESLRKLPDPGAYRRHPIRRQERK
jgi:hypothetical protein